MPKMKSHRGLAKRVKKTGSGKLKRGSTNKNHRMHGKTTKQSRHARKSQLVSPSDYKRIKHMIQG